MNKILILTANSGRHYYFVNKIIENYPDNSSVILNGKAIKRSFHEKCKRQLKKPYTFLKNRILNLVFSKASKKLDSEKQEKENYYFGAEKKIFFSKYSSHILDKVMKDDRSLNSQRIVDVINKYEPDIIVVMGTCLVSKKIIKSAKVVLNIHTGLSPYYRGGASNFWPFINKDLDKFGVTIHLMTTGIDSGPIIYSEAIKFNLGDTYPEINCKAIIRGTDLMLRALDKVIKGNYVVAEQWSKGLVYHSFNYNHFYAFKYYRLLNSKKLTSFKRVKNQVITITNGEKLYSE